MTYRKTDPSRPALPVLTLLVTAFLLVSLTVPALADIQDFYGRWESYGAPSSQSDFISIRPDETYTWSWYEAGERTEYRGYWKAEGATITLIRGPQKQNWACKLTENAKKLNVTGENGRNVVFGIPER